MRSFLTQFCVWSIARITATRSYNFAKGWWYHPLELVFLFVSNIPPRLEEYPNVYFPSLTSLDKNHPPVFHVTSATSWRAQTSLPPVNGAAWNRRQWSRENGRKSGFKGEICERVERTKSLTKEFKRVTRRGGKKLRRTSIPRQGIIIFAGRTRGESALEAVSKAARAHALRGSSIF